MDQLEKAFKKHFYDNREDALNRARQMADERSRIDDKKKHRIEVLINDDASFYKSESEQ
jgi:DNA sulfur modification protein DndC